MGFGVARRGVTRVWLAAAVACLAAGGVLLRASGAPEAPQGPEGPAVLTPGEYRVGELIQDAGFVDVERKPGRLSDYRGRVLVVAMTGVTCPVARKYTPVLADLERAYRKRDVAFVLVNPNRQAADDSLREMVRAAGFDGRTVSDPEGK